MSFRCTNFRGCNGRRNGFQRFRNEMTIKRVIPIGTVTHTCQGDLIVKSNIQDVPYNSASVFTEDKKEIGKIDDIFGSLHDYWVSVKLRENITIKTFKPSEKLYIDPNKLIPLQKFMPKPAEQKKTGKRTEKKFRNKKPLLKSNMIKPRNIAAKPQRGRMAYRYNKHQRKCY